MQLRKNIISFFMQYVKIGKTIWQIVYNLKYKITIMFIDRSKHPYPLFPIFILHDTFTLLYYTMSHLFLLSLSIPNLS